MKRSYHFPCRKYLQLVRKNERKKKKTFSGKQQECKPPFLPIPDTHGTRYSHTKGLLLNYCADLLPGMPAVSVLTVLQGVLADLV